MRWSGVMQSAQRNHIRVVPSMQMQMVRNLQGKWFAREALSKQAILMKTVNKYFQFLDRRSCVTIATDWFIDGCLQWCLMYSRNFLCLLFFFLFFTKKRKKKKDLVFWSFSPCEKEKQGEKN